MTQPSASTPTTSPLLTTTSAIHFALSSVTRAIDAHVRGLPPYSPTTQQDLRLALQLLTRNLTWLVTDGEPRIGDPRALWTEAMVEGVRVRRRPKLKFSQEAALEAVLEITRHACRALDALNATDAGHPGPPLCTALARVEDLAAMLDLDPLWIEGAPS